MKIKRNELIGFFGFGIFSYKFISSLSYSFTDFTKDLLISLDSQPYWVFWISELVGLILFVILINNLINWIFDNYKTICENILKYLIWSFSAYFIIQIVQISYPSIKSFFEFGKENVGFTEYYGYLRKNYILYFTQSIFYYLGEIITVILIYNKTKND
ncbi:hypothetical protein MBM09_05515 [Flaviramulus sp. BrNp1-15]|uniref:hypothetical protein n=1 Tax=Flaviramulus sp. BrNp1-15 TaxID=2916754 RepID=UPI001EE81A88|nr:hypothetical protein [Flaviramulus sp. BrNp1-15]ULC60445.1 hypothetical protein MBM09_05515 [Flaviramulus sp. BrNp1-15]